VNFLFVLIERFFARCYGSAGMTAIINKMTSTNPAN